MLPQELQKIMFLDIETVPQTNQFGLLSDELQHLWQEKITTLKRRMPDRYADTDSNVYYESEAGIYSEFGKIICISVGYLYVKNGKSYFRTKSFYSDNEKALLTDFCHLVEKFFTTKDHTFCGHNIKEFDIPYICRRILINDINLPDALNVTGKKPWEVNFIDTLELWRFGDFKNYTPLKLLTAVFGIPTPKDDIDGSMVAQVYYQERDLLRIAEYCRKDVVATLQVFLRIKGLNTIPTENIELI
jgi:3'-5' exonuclease